MLRRGRQKPCLTYTLKLNIYILSIHVYTYHRFEHLAPTTGKIERHLLLLLLLNTKHSKFHFVSPYANKRKMEFSG